MNRECPFCNGSTASTHPFKDTMFWECGGCGLFINLPMTDDQIKAKNKTMLLSACHNEKNRIGRLKEAKEVQVATIEDNLFYQEDRPDPVKVYDVGAASGFFMKAAEEAGWWVYGNEVSTSAIAWAKDHYGLNIEYGVLEDIIFHDMTGHNGFFHNETYDAVVLWNTLEHTRNPQSTLQCCWDMLVPGGLIYIKVPNKKTAEELKSQYKIVHLFEFTDECLCKHLEYMGFEQVEIERNEVNPRSGVVAGVYLYRKPLQ